MTEEIKEKEELFGVVETITFHNPENGYTVAKIKHPKKKELIPLVGKLPSLQKGETVRCHGTWKDHLTHGIQFEADSISIEAPSDINGIKKYLGSGLVRGIGPVFAKKIVDFFGIETLSVIENSPERLSEIGGIGEKKIDKIKKSFEEQKAVRDAMLFLQVFDLTPLLAQKMYRALGKDCVRIVKENPYALCKHLKGIGFKTADKIAEKVGITKDCKERKEAGILFLMQELSQEGHTCYPKALLVKAAALLLETAEESLEEVLKVLVEEERLHLESLLWEGAVSPFYYLPYLIACEKGVAKELRRLSKSKSTLASIDQEKALPWVQETLNIALAEKQELALKAAILNKVQIITGGPGTGKSTITKALLTILSKKTKSIVLAAPTGRAAKRLSEITGWKAKTIHSLLEFDFKNGGFKRKKENPIECDFILIDESSMIDTALMYSLLRAIPSHAKVVLVGDIHQLPSVGPGNVLKDIIESKIIPLTELKEIFRQAKGSSIITNAHKINMGVFPEVQNSPDSDFFFFDAAEVDKALETILHLATQRIPEKFNFDPLKDIQVLSPMKKGALGTIKLNQLLQSRLNPKKEHVSSFGTSFKVGDKVMQLKNNYEKEVFNGDIGYIQEIDLSEETVVIHFDEKEVLYDLRELNEICLAYAVSIHKYQGSEAPCIIIPIHNTHFMMLNRNLIYTGVTRGKKLVILVGSKKALMYGVKNDKVKERFTGLKHFLGDTVLVYF